MPRWMKHRTARWMTTEGLGISTVNPWTGATWALTGGRAYNTPTLGSEVIVNQTLDDASWWTAETGVAISGGSANWSGINSNSSIYRLAVITPGLWYRFGLDITAYTQGRAYAESGAVGNSRSAVGSYVDTLRASATLVVFRGLSLSALNPILSIDNLSCKPLTLATLPATVVGVAGQTVTAKPYAITTGTQAGVISHLDSAVSPANFIIAYHDGGTSIRMDKCVGGTYTSLVSATTGFVSDAVIEIRSLGSNQFDCYYNGTKRGLTATVNDAGIISNTRYGLFSTYSANQFSTDFTLGGVAIPFTLPGA